MPSGLSFSCFICLHHGTRLYTTTSAISARPHAFSQSLFNGTAIRRRRVHIRAFGKFLSRLPFMSTKTQPEAASSPNTTAINMESAPAEDEVDPGQVEGTDLRVLRYPHPLLREKNTEIMPEEIDLELKRVAKEMLLVMYASRGVGLAAPQVGINKRLMVFNPEGDAKAWLQEIVMVNPKIISSSKSAEMEAEGCLSFPGMSGEVRRSEWVKVEATRLNGKKFKVKLEGWKARIFQHEYDHLDGILYIDRLPPEERKRVQPRLNELVSEYTVAPYHGKPGAL